MSSKGQQYLARRSNDDDNNAGDTDAVQENEASSLYGGLRNAFNVGRAFVEVHPSDEPKWTKDTVGEKSPQVQWIAALNEKRNRVGKVQNNENPFTMGEYEEAHGTELPGIESAEVSEDDIDILGGAGHEDADEFYGLHVPVVDGEPLPVVVTSMDELNDALALLDQLPDEPDHAEEPEQEELTPIEEAALALDMDESSIEEKMEGHDLPTELSVAELRDQITSLSNEGVVAMMLDIENVLGQRKTAVKALEGRLNKLRSPGGSDGESTGSGASGYLGGSSDEGEDEDDEESAESAVPDDASRETRMKMALSLMEDGLGADEAKAQVGL